MSIMTEDAMKWYKKFEQNVNNNLFPGDHFASFYDAGEELGYIKDLPVKPTVEKSCEGCEGIKTDNNECEAGWINCQGKYYKPKIKQDIPDCINKKCEWRNKKALHKCDYRNNPTLCYIYKPEPLRSNETPPKDDVVEEAKKEMDAYYHEVMQLAKMGDKGHILTRYDFFASEVVRLLEARIKELESQLKCRTENDKKIWQIKDKRYAKLEANCLKSREQNDRYYEAIEKLGKEYSELEAELKKRDDRWEELKKETGFIIKKGVEYKISCDLGGYYFLSEYLTELEKEKE